MPDPDSPTKATFSPSCISNDIFFRAVTGRVVGKGIPTDHWERTCEKGFQLVYGATANLFVDRHGR